MNSSRHSARGLATPKGANISERVERSPRAESREPRAESREREQLLRWPHRLTNPQDPAEVCGHSQPRAPSSAIHRGDSRRSEFPVPQLLSKELARRARARPTIRRRPECRAAQSHRRVATGRLGLKVESETCSCLGLAATDLWRVSLIVDPGERVVFPVPS